MHRRHRHVRELCLCLAAVLTVSLLAFGISVQLHFVEIDTAVVRVVTDAAITPVTAVLLDITALGGTPVVMTITALCFAGLLITRHWHGALALVLSVAVTQVVVYGIKAIVERDRPAVDGAHAEAAGYAFPSAHAATSVALYGLLALVAVAHLRGAMRASACVVAVGIITAVGLTRVYLGAHYPTDVLAGWLIGAVIALAAWRSAQAIRRAAGEAPALA